MVFTTPLFLVLLLAFPFFIWLGWPSRGPSRGREIASLILRLLIALLLILSLAGLEIKRAADDLSVIFLVDNSDSMSLLAKQLAQGYVRDALTHMGLKDRAGVILFGGEALVERPLSSSPDLENFTSKVTSLQTDLAEAIRLALAMLPADTARRIVIISDGRETTGDAWAAVQLARASGAQVVVVPFLQTTGEAEALVRDVTVPPNVRQGEQFGLDITVEATVAQTVGVRVLAGADVVYEGTLDLNRGTNRFTLPLVAGVPGFVAYHVQIIPPQDALYQNNELATFTQIAGPPRVLLVKNPTPRDGVAETRELLAALRAANLQVEEVEPGGLPSELPALAEYAAVVLVDVPAAQLSPRQMTALQTYVRDLGGGLVAVGGPSAYGVGGYFRTPLEEMLPVEMQIKDQKRRAKVCIVFIIDHSGSMADSSGGVPKVELAKEAVIRSLDLLMPQDKVGVIAFDDSASWVVNITPLDNPDAVKRAVGTIRPDGGTDIYAGVKAAADVLPGDDSTVRHIILLTDGGADPSGIPAMVTKLYNDYGITLSTVGVGSDAAPFLPELAKAGGGVYHFAANPSAIPSIFAEETSLATRAYIIEEEFFPQVGAPSPILEGVTSVPALLGYIGTTAKASAQTVLLSDQKDPVLATWRYGLGKAVAWTSDATGRWAKNWVSWDQFARFWGQTVRYALSEGAASPVNVQVSRVGERAIITVDAQSDTGAYLNGLTVQANVIDPSGQTRTVTLQQVAPGTYTGDFVPTAEGAYLIRMTGVDLASGVSLAQTAGWVLSYSPEYQRLAEGDRTAANLLVRLADMNDKGQPLLGVGEGGVVLYDVLWNHQLQAPARGSRPVWPWLLLVAALLLPFDIAVRRLVLTRYDVQRAGQKVRRWWERSTPHLRPAPAPRTERLSTLMQAKDRAAPRDKEAGSTPSAPLVRETKFAPELAQKPETQPRPTSSPPPEPQAPAGGSTSAALLAAKKRARDKKG